MQADPDTDWVPLLDDTFIGEIGGVLQRRRNGAIQIGLLSAERHKNLSGIVHGGLVMALFDRTIGVNCREACPDERMATASMTVNLMRQVKVGDFIEFHCNLRKQGRKAFFADAEAWGGDKLVATTSGIWMKVA